MGEQDQRILTIGYSTRSLSSFVTLLRRHGVTAVADVRSHPYSRAPDFNRESLSAALRAEGIEYVFLGRELGARRSEEEAYANGRALYERVADLPAFRAGLDRLRKGAEEYTVALMCAEKDPVDCHRAVLICRHLRAWGFHIEHIIADGDLEAHEDTEKRLVQLTDNSANLFDHATPGAARVERAYEARGRKIAYRQAQEERSHG